MLLPPQLGHRRRRLRSGRVAMISPPYVGNSLRFLPFRHRFFLSHVLYQTPLPATWTAKSASLPIGGEPPGDGQSGAWLLTFTEILRPSYHILRHASTESRVAHGQLPFLKCRGISILAWVGLASPRRAIPGNGPGPPTPARPSAGSQWPGSHRVEEQNRRSGPRACVGQTLLDSVLPLCCELL
jgi:hypothetical protein